MRSSRHVVAILATTLVLAAAFAWARRSAPEIERLEPNPSELRTTLSGPALSTRRKSVATTAVTEADVGDIDSFGRTMRWIGLASMNVRLASDCTGAGPGCQVLGGPGALTSFSFDDLGRVRLPPRATNSLLCYWFSPVLTVNYANATASPAKAMLFYTPTLTIENPVLADPGLVDPTTGLPFGGKLETSMTASERFELPLQPGEQVTERLRDSAVCMAGFISRKMLSETYGLTDAQVADFFRSETMVRMNIRGGARHVQDASMIFGLRIIGD